MPIYDYKCDKCDDTIELLQTFSAVKEEAPEVCNKCKTGHYEKQFAPSKRIGIDFIGPGFFINDYGKHNYKRNMSVADQTNVLLGHKDPY
jgi:putative FmdB family regulatory protein